jgi:hypothetical protein
VSNVLIAESDNDIAFLKAIIQHLNEVVNCSLTITEYYSLGGIDNLENQLKILRKNLEKENFQKIGIVCDLDRETRLSKFDWVNHQIQKIFPEAEYINNTQNLFQLTSVIDTQIGCYFVHIKEGDESGQIQEYGELETVLRQIKTQPSPHADCIEAWKSCVEAKKRETEPEFSISQKAIDKKWIQNYIREDTPSKKEKRKADNINLVKALEKKEIWNFAHPSLDELKEFLLLFA